MRNPIIITLVLLGAIQLCAQNFIDAPKGKFLHEQVYSANNMAMVDLNRDGLSDMVESDYRRIVISWGARHDDYSHTQIISYDDLDSWSMTIGDIDNNGILDIIQTRFSDSRMVIYSGTKGPGLLPTYTQTDAINIPDLFQSINLIDLNKDGDLDIFACNDFGTNFYYENDGSGQFIQNTSQFDFNTVPASDNSGSYGSVWSDLDKDGQPELYISRCYANSTTGIEPQRINQLFYLIDTIYRDRAPGLGVASIEQSWASDIFDANLDGEWDIIVGNHSGQTELFMNNGSVYRDEANKRNIDVKQQAMQILAFDADNDGDEDVLITGNGETLLINDGSGYFMETELPNSFMGVHSATVGDLNNDGVMDIAGSFATSYNNESNTRSNRYWYGMGNDNNFVKIQLEGDQSNKFGIGSRVEIFTQGSMQMREVRSSTSFGIIKDLDVHFGVGQYELIDSIKIYWPSGIVDQFNSLIVNQRYIAVENSELIKMNFDVEMNSDDLFLCEESLTLDAGVGDSYLWSTGDTTRTLEVDAEGFYVVEKIVDNRLIQLMPFSIKKEQYEIDVVSNKVDSICYGSEYELNAQVYPARSIVWNTGDTTNNTIVTTSGSYSYEVIGACQNYYSDTINLSAEILSGENTIDTIKKGEDFTFSAESDRANWYSDYLLTNRLAIGAEFKTQNNQKDLELFYTINDTISHESKSHGLKDRGSVYGFNPDDVNDFTYVTPKYDVTLNEFTVYTDTVRELNFVIQDELGLDYFEHTTLLDSGKNIIPVEVFLVANVRYKFKTDDVKNLENFGTQSPQLYRSNGVNFPLEGDLLTVEARTLTLHYYYYFYDIKVSVPTSYCESEIYSAMLYVDSFSSTNEISLFSDVRISPNPASDQITITGKEEISSIQWFESNGQFISREAINARELNVDISTFKPGLYLLKIFKHNAFTVRKIVVLE